MTFRVGLSRDVLDARGEPSYGRAALAVLSENPAIEWEFLPEIVAEITPVIAARYDALHVNSPRVTAASLAGNRRVRLIARHGVGYDSVDVAACTAAGVLVTNTPIAVRRPMAVAALTLIFALAARLPTKDRLVRENRWAERTHHMGVGLAGRTLGIVGAGGIGRELMGLARPFFARMITADPHGDAAAVQALGASLTSLDTVLAESDFVVLACLLTGETRHLIGAAQLARMKPAAFLVNIARGPVCDEAALVDALGRKAIAGAGLDVFEQEPIAPGHPLQAMDHVLLTPHAIGWTDECFHAIATDAFRAIVDVSLGRKPAHPVNPAAWRG